MRIALLGRTHILLSAGRELVRVGHQIVLVATARPSEFYSAVEDDYAAFARSVGADYFAGSFRDDRNMSLLRSASPDIGVSMNWPTIVPAEVVESFAHGILNAHAGDLPRYRGNACPNWAIINGEPHVGLCVHFMQPDSLDSGSVLMRERMPLTPATYIGEVYDWLEKAIPRMFVASLNLIATGQEKHEVQDADPVAALRCFPRRPEDARVEWRQAADTILRLIRASSNPFSGAFAFLEGQRRVRIWRASAYESATPYCAVPGQVIARTDAGVAIACGEGALLLTKVTYDSGEDALTDIAVSLRNRLT